MDITFIVGTGRCGSTMFSRMLRAHPDVLSVNELFASLACRGDRAFRAPPTDGAGFWSLLSRPSHQLDAVAASEYRPPEMVYPYTHGRFRPLAGMPAIAHMVLPALTAGPDAPYDDLSATVPHWPYRPLADHYRELFADLGPRLGRSVVVERSGASLAVLPALRAMFPEARFVHLSRSGPACALSMSRHIAFRMMLLRTEAAKAFGACASFGLRPEHATALPGRMDCDLVMRALLPLAAFGRFWSDLVTSGVDDFLRLPPERRAALSYEDVLERPEHHLERLASFIGVDPDPAWLHGVAASVVRRSRPPVTDPDTLAACAPGERALERQGRLLRDHAAFAS
ncbi:sulfotransferase [Kitasatospora phosalacinea]|uniref:sulfotransferase n=1 Tax=Kitasatospora phosalacinea TaxID=2065 RepID=UPI003664CCF5